MERLDVTHDTDNGMERGLNEDAVWSSELHEGAENPWQLSALLILADGMGGHDAGEVASSLALQTVREIFATPQGSPAPEDLSGNNLLLRVRESVQYVNKVVHALSEGRGTSRPGTTLTFCLARSHEYYIGHVGDSRAYHIGRNSVKQVTQDDSVVAEAVRRGQMSEDEARVSQFRNHITKAIGLQPEVEPSEYYGTWETGDMLLLCSDGLTEYVTGDEMLRLAQSGDSLEQICQSLIAMANERGGHDNISVAVARYMPDLSNGAAPPATRKPKTWPPTEASAAADAARAANAGAESKRSSRVSRVVVEPAAEKAKAGLSKLSLALICLAAVLALAAGLWFGLPRRPVVPAQASSNIIVMVPKPGKPSKPKGAPVPLSARTPQPTPEPLPETPPILGPAKLTFFPKIPVPIGLLVECPGYAIDYFESGISTATGAQRVTGIQRIEKGVGQKGFVNFSEPKATAEELVAGGYFQVFSGHRSKKRLAIGGRLTKDGHVTFELENGEYSIFFFPHGGKARREPTVTFRVHAMSDRALNDNASSDNAARMEELR